jgi:hypothetical protein
VEDEVVGEKAGRRQPSPHIPNVLLHPVGSGIQSAKEGTTHRKANQNTQNLTHVSI